MAIKHKINGNIKPKYAQTRPEYTGEQNMTNIGKVVSKGDEYKLGVLKTVRKLEYDREDILLETNNKFENIPNNELSKSDLMRKYRQQRYSYWTEDSLRYYTDKFFDWCVENEITPSKSLMCKWFACSINTLDKWAKKDDFFGDIIGDAYYTLEVLFVNDLDNRAVPNMFRLKAMHGFVETQKVEVSKDSVDKMSTSELESALDNIIT